MPLTVALVLVVVFAFLVSRALHRYATNTLILWSLEYVLVGFVVGPIGLGVLEDAQLEVLSPFVSLNLGLVGFALGLPLRRRVRRLSHLVFGLMASTLTIVAVAWLMDLVLARLLPDLAADERLWLATALGAASASCSVQIIESAGTAFKAQGPTVQLLRSFAVASNVTAVTVAGLLLALARARDGSGRLGLSEPAWLLGSAGLGLALGLLFWFFVGHEREERAERTFLATVGVVIFASGLAAAIGISPLLLNVLAGVVVSLLPRTERLAVAIERLEAPALIILLIFAGALIRPTMSWLLLLPIIYTAARYVAFRFATGLAARVVPDVVVVPRFGNGVVAQGAIAAAIAVNFAQVNKALGGIALMVVLLGLVLSDVVSVSGLRELLTDAGEVGHAQVPVTEERRA
ncbi:MAG: cation:proton antiporter [Myxococcales bacterium]|nr:cation:proton antiporter [Myxococcales bacterium]MCB9649787.1 cation:proton antiporter [Deltaproteobacteria bacterium]